MIYKLVKIDRKDLSLLKTLYTPDRSKSYIAYIIIDTYIRWFEQDPNVKHIIFFCLNGDFTDGTFVVTDRCEAYADTFNKSYDRLFQLLQLINYSKGYTFHVVRAELMPVFTNAFDRINVNLESVTEFLLHYLPKEKALKLDTQPPKGIELRSLTELPDLEKIVSVWSIRNENSLAFIQRLAKFNPSVGAFTEDGTLVAWVLRFPTGLLATLQTDDKFYGKGYGGLVLRCLSKNIAKMGHDVYAGVLRENAASLLLFRKYGFKIVCISHLIKTKITWTPADE